MMQGSITDHSAYASVFSICEFIMAGWALSESPNKNERKLVLDIKY